MAIEGISALVAIVDDDDSMLAPARFAVTGATATRTSGCQALRAGAVECLAKPFDSEELLVNVPWALES